MDVQSLADLATEEFSKACAAAIGRGSYAERARGIRSHQRAATASLVRLVVVSERARRDHVGQMTFDWERPGDAVDAQVAGTS